MEVQLYAILQQLLYRDVAVFRTVPEVGQTEGLYLLFLRVFLRDIPIAIPYEIMEVDDRAVPFALLLVCLWHIRHELPEFTRLVEEILPPLSSEHFAESRQLAFPDELPQLLERGLRFHQSSRPNHAGSEAVFRALLAEQYADGFLSIGSIHSDGAVARAFAQASVASASRIRAFALLRFSHLSFPFPLK